jgi:hypothetical protein
MDKDLLAQYGEANIALEIAQNKYNEIKRKVVEALNQPKEAEPVKE